MVQFEAQLDNGRIQKDTLERALHVSQIARILEKLLTNHLIEDVLGKTHVSDFPYSSSFSCKSHLKLATRFFPQTVVYFDQTFDHELKDRTCDLGMFE